MHGKRFFTLALLAMAPACLPDFPSRPDGGNPDSGDLAAPPGSDLSNSGSCVALTAPPSNGHHNAGMACLPCHDGNTATRFSVGGTLFNAVTGGSAVAGATVVLTDANNQQVQIVTSQNGNFYTSTTLAMPVVARASGCPNDVPMISKATGNCNMSGCHDSNLQVHLP